MTKAMRKLAIVRGPNLNKWEAQNYEPLLDRYDITAYTTTQPLYDLSQIRLPIVQIPIDPNQPNRGILTYMPGLESHLADKDIIYTADITWFFSFQAVLAKEQFGGKVICMEWENIPFVHEEHQVVGRIKEFVRSRADYFIAVTRKAREALLFEGVPEEKIEIIPVGVDVKRFKPVEDTTMERKELGIGRDEVVILFIGRMVWEKGVYDLIHAAVRLLSDRSLSKHPVRFLMVGDGQELKGIKERVKRFGLSSWFTFVESFSYQEIHRFHNLSDIFVLPSIPIKNWQEQFGMVLVESMACGRPVVTTLSGSIPEVVDDAGILVQPCDPSSLYEGLKRLVLDRNLREELGIKARKRAVAEFDSRKIAERLNDAFERVLAGEVKEKWVSQA